MKQKRIIAGMLTLAFALAMLAFPVSALEMTNVEEKDFSLSELSPVAKKALSDIPIFITYIDDSQTTELQPIKEEANVQIREFLEDINDADMAQSLIQNKSFDVIDDDYQISQLTEPAVEMLFENPLYSSTFNRANELLEQGVIINYINIFASEVISTSSLQASATSDPSDPAYWESRYLSLGTSSGYKFLYQETAINVESNWVTPNNIKSSYKWTSIANYVIKFTIGKTSFKSLKTANVIHSTLSAVFSGYTAPYSVTYGSSSGYFLAKVSGDLYVRNFFIRDLLGRSPAYAYMDAGTTEKFVAVPKYDIKYPVSKNTSGTYNYKYITRNGASSTVTSEGFSGPSATLTYLREVYARGAAVWLQTEKIDVRGTISDMIM